jgi:type I restriction enzyme R subunit
MTKNTSPSNFSYLKVHDEQLMRLGMLSEKYYVDDPNTCLLKMRQFGELLAQLVAAQMGLLTEEGESQYKLVFRLQDEGVISREIYQLFGEIRRAGNAASHDVQGDKQVALNVLRMGWQLGVWFHRTFKDAGFDPGEFIPPSDTSAREQLATEVDQAQDVVQERLVEQQVASERKQSRTINKYRQAAQAASQNLYLDEAATRQLIDEQLRQAGWEVDTVNLRHGNGTRP